jgi:hypothetical protein
MWFAGMPSSGMFRAAFAAPTTVVDMQKMTRFVPAKALASRLAAGHCR